MTSAPRRRVKTQPISKLQSELTMSKMAKAIKNPKEALARLATKYLDYYNGFSYDFEKNGESDLILKLRSLNPKTVFDVGANIGDWSKIALGNFPQSKIHSFELSKSTYTNLTKNIQSDRVFLNNFGLAAEEGSFTYKDYGENAGVKYNSLVSYLSRLQYTAATHHGSATNWRWLLRRKQDRIHRLPKNRC